LIHTEQPAPVIYDFTVYRNIRKQKGKKFSIMSSELLRAENAWKTFGNRLPDILEFKTYKLFFEKLFRPKGEPVPEVPEGIQ